MAKPDKVKSKKKLKVDFTGVETRTHIPDGEYHAKVGEITVEEGNAAQYLKWVFEIMDEKFAGRKLYYNTSLAAQALWNLRNLLETLGIDTPDGVAELDLDSYRDLELMVRVESEVYEGKERPKVTDFKPLEDTAASDDDEKGDDEEEGDEEGEEEAEEEAEAEEEEEVETKLTAAEVREMNEKELADLVKQHSLGVKLDKLPKLSKKIAAVLDAMEAKDLLATED